MMILMDGLSQMCLKCQYEAKNYTLKEAKDLNWWNIALGETNRDGQKFKEGCGAGKHHGYGMVYVHS